VAETGGVKARMRAKAARALIRYTHSAINDLKGDEDEMLRGALPCVPSCGCTTLII
jgi:hypothetical protein